jgi:5-(carboxyamino)imidazole ribonucleotide synthase
MAMECRRVGAEPYVVSQNSDDPAAKVVKHWCQYRLPLMGGSNWKAEELRETESYSKLIDFISCTDLLTIESEFIDLSFLRHLSQQKLLCPSEKVLEITQSKLEQKKLFSKLNISTAEFAEVKTVEDIENALSLWGDVVIKKGQLGYDGNGVRFLSCGSGNKSSAKIAEEFYVEFKSWMQFEVYVERKIKFRQELALLVARDRQGNCEFFPLVFTEQKNGICNKVWIPEKPFSKKLTHKIQNSALKVLEKLDGIGVFAFELFLTSRGEIIFNEMAPRVHNSGHITLDVTI